MQDNTTEPQLLRGQGFGLSLWMNKARSLAELHAADVLEAVGRIPITSVTELEAALEQLADRETVLVKVRTVNGRDHSRIVVWHR